MRAATMTYPIESTGPTLRVDAGCSASPQSLANRFARVAWGLVSSILFRPSPKPCHAWRRMLLRMFGAKIGRGAHVHPSCRIWAPWNLHMGDHSCLAPHTDCYCVAPISIGANSTVSQYAYLCAASHDCERPNMPLITEPIDIGKQAWICAGAFIGPGVRVGEGGVVGARAAVFRDVDPWTVVRGNPASFIKKRVLEEQPSV